jgi:hypothetical protein
MKVLLLAFLALLLESLGVAGVAVVVSAILLYVLGLAGPGCWLVAG